PVAPERHQGDIGRVPGTGQLAHGAWHPDDPVVGGGDVGHVRGRVGGHVTVDTAVLLLAPAGRWLGTGARAVAAQAAGTGGSEPLLGFDGNVRVVTGDAAELALSRGTAEAGALVHLLDVVDRLAVGRATAGADEDRPERLKGHPRTKVVQPAP